MKKTNNKHKVILFIALFLVFCLFLVGLWYFHHTNIPVLNPKGPVALKEFHLIIFTLLLSLVIVIPVFTVTIVFAWKYRENNHAKYSPELVGNRFVETIWWIIPSALILILAVVTWNSSYDLDPYKPLTGGGHPPMLIQVVALDWKWLFIYPKQNIATVNYFLMPTNTPVTFEITSDAPMNSFWIPQLGGQIYAMPGMTTQLNLLATSNGSYNGSSANISGTGFSGMTFTAKATSENTFNNWVDSVRNSSSSLNLPSYTQLSRPSINNPTASYSSASNNLFNEIVNTYNTPPGSIVNNSSISMQGMGM